MESYTIHVELREGTADDYVKLNAAMTHQRFAPVNNQAVAGADFTLESDLSLEIVLFMVRAAVSETRKRFSISVNEQGVKGLGLAG